MNIFHFTCDLTLKFVLFFSSFFLFPFFLVVTERGIRGIYRRAPVGGGWVYVNPYSIYPLLHTLYTFITIFTPIYTRYTCIYTIHTIYTPNTHLNTPYTPLYTL